MDLVKILTWALPAVIVLATLEALVLTLVARRPYHWRSYAASLIDALGREYVVSAFVTASMAGPVIGFVWQHRLATIPLNAVTTFAVLFVGQEFCYYWYHRAAHRVRWFWATHAVHPRPTSSTLASPIASAGPARSRGTPFFMCR
jgi:sterol desaturase/sphingolipid hydroxylase (fatty acid hydroxylase superfamily)